MWLSSCSGPHPPLILGVRRRVKLAIERGWLVMHESGTYVKFTQAGAELFA